MAFGVMCARLRRTPGPRAAGYPGYKQLGTHQAGLQQRHRGQQYGSCEAARVSYVLRFSAGKMFRQRTNKVAEEMWRTMRCAVYPFIGRGVPVAKVCRYIDNMNTDIPFIRLLEDVRDHCRRGAVRRSREQCER